MIWPKYIISPHTEHSAGQEDIRERCMPGLSGSDHYSFTLFSIEHYIKNMSCVCARVYSFMTLLA